MGGAKEYYLEQVDEESRKQLLWDLINEDYLYPLEEEEEEEEENKELKLVQLAKKIIASGTSSLSPSEFQIFHEHLEVFHTCSTCERIISTKKCFRCEQDNAEALQEFKELVSTKKVYFFRCGEHLKIGTTKGDTFKRRSQLQTGNPHPIEELGSIPGSYVTENILHQLLKHCRGLGEWFKVEPYILDLVQILLNPRTAPQIINTST